MTDELLPCPFCGGAAKLFKGHLGFWHVMCSQSDYSECSVIPITNGMDTETEAIAVWNRRSVTASAVYGYKAAERTCRNLANHQGRTEFVCSECATHYIGFRFDYCPSCGCKVVSE